VSTIKKLTKAHLGQEMILTSVQIGAVSSPHTAGHGKGMLAMVITLGFDPASTVGPVLPPTIVDQIFYMCSVPMPNRSRNQKVTANSTHTRFLSMEEISRLQLKNYRKWDMATNQSQILKISVSKGTPNIRYDFSHYENKQKRM
jgi:hypothetical protein